MFNLPYKSLITEKDVYTYSGYRLKTRLAKGDEANMDIVVNLFLQECARMIYDYIPAYLRDEFYSDKDNENILKRCQLYQAVYIFENGGDISGKVGLETVIRTGYITIDQLRGSRSIAPSAVKELAKAKLFL